MWYNKFWKIPKNTDNKLPSFTEIGQMLPLQTKKCTIIRLVTPLYSNFLLTKFCFIYVSSVTIRRVNNWWNKLIFESEYCKRLWGKLSGTVTYLFITFFEIMHCSEKSQKVWEYFRENYYFAGGKCKWKGKWLNVGQRNLDEHDKNVPFQPINGERFFDVIL